MTEQDGADSDATEANAHDGDAAEANAHDEDAAEADSPEAERSADGLDEIAEEPADDVDTVLREILEDSRADVADVDVSAAVEERVADADDDALATEIAALRTRVDSLGNQLAEREEEVDDLESRLARKQADFQNYKKRQEKRLEQEKARATEDLVARLLDVRDNLRRALDQDEDVDIRDGVASTLRQFDEELDRENVERIEPEPGTDVDPQRHEVLVRVDSDAPEDTVADLHRPGYEMAGKVLREAQVTVSDGPTDAETEDAGQAGETGETEGVDESAEDGDADAGVADDGEE